ncbi:putative Hydantoinase B/oxoprolinase-domain-containing protein [Seiridium unicorne]|uniref:Hydantoinase B/oxoprolinase-domain-containing protein n=1 Tax=Seiridium unicorne TaxID=138068 RepID=A0ABR2V8D5_9PEZI
MHRNLMLGLVREELVAQGAREKSISFDESLSIRYFGTNTNLTISRPHDEDYGAAFSTEHKREFAFNLERAGVVDANTPPTQELEHSKSHPQPADTTKSQGMFMDGTWSDANTYYLSDVAKGVVIDGPAMILDETQTLLAEPSFRAYILSNHVVMEKVDHSTVKNENVEEDCNPIQLSVFAHRFMSIAEQMGNTLQRTSISTSIRGRLDFSCALFSPDGQLVANAPHIPMSQHRYWNGKLHPGDVLMTNHPEWGGTHLPDITVVTPVFVDGEIAFYTASRGQHTDIGGKGITSMMPDSVELWEEGLNVPTMKIVSGGKFLEDEVRAEFNRPRASANQRGITLTEKLCEEFSLPIVHKYMRGIQSNAEVAVREFLKGVAKEHPNGLEAEDYYDNGTKIKLKITVDAEPGSAVYDFAGTGPQGWGNINCPIAITHYAIRAPKGSVLNPHASVAICGSTLASQRVIDIILKVYNAVAAFQGCASSFGWGMGGGNPKSGGIEPGWNYGESIGGGTGAGLGWHGEHAIHAHSTNTRMTDAEVIEKRTQVIVRRYEIAHGTGGRGKWNGGNGITREIEARFPLKSSILSERRVFPPYGLEDGNPGSIGRNFVFWENGQGGYDKINLGSQAVVNLRAGESAN